MSRFVAAVSAAPLPLTAVARNTLPTITVLARFPRACRPMVVATTLLPPAVPAVFVFVPIVKGSAADVPCASSTRMPTL